MSKKAAVITAVAAVIGLPIAVFAAKPLTQGSLIDSPASSDVTTPDVTNEFIDTGVLNITDGSDTTNNEESGSQQGSQTNQSTVDVNVNGTQINVSGPGKVHKVIKPTPQNNATIDVHIETGNSGDADIDIDSNGFHHGDNDNNDPLRDRTEPHR